MSVGKVRVEIRKPDRTTLGPFRADREGQTWTLFTSQQEIAPGDILRPIVDANERPDDPTLNVIVAATFRDGLLDIPDTWVIEVEPRSRPEGRRSRVDYLIDNSDLVPFGAGRLGDVIAAFESIVSQIEKSEASTFDKQEARSILFQTLKKTPLRKTLGIHAKAIRHALLQSSEAASQE